SNMENSSMISSCISCIVMSNFYAKVQFGCCISILSPGNPIKRALCQHALGPFDPLDQKVHFLHGIVKAETGPYRARDPIEIHDGLRTVVAGSHRNAQFVEDGSDIIGMDPLDVKGYHGGLFLGRTIDFKAIDVQQFLG